MKIYLDNNATTRPLPEVLEAMLPFYTEFWGNASSLHCFGSRVAPHIDRAREEVARLIGAARPSEITFTGGGTESNNLALRGLLPADPSKKELITTRVEHSSVIRTAARLEEEGFRLTLLPAGRDGTFRPEELEKAITPDTGLVSVMWANNETGVLFPMEAIAKICARKEVPFHVDAVQAAGKIPIDLRPLPGITCLSLSAHKLHGPKGVGALYVRRGTKFRPLITGGSQEYGRRAGTENTAGMVGFGRACELARLHLAEGALDKTARLRDKLESTLLKKYPWIVRTADGAPRVPNTSSLSFVGLAGETICLLLSEMGVAASTGSACSAGNLGPSRILTAMGLSHEEAFGTVRFSLSFETTEKEIDDALAIFDRLIERLKK